MATQDLIGGGFRGKCGKLIGEKWHGIYYVKEYVKPANPRTPAQMAVRAKFAQAIKCMQVGMSLSGHQGYLPITHRNEAQERTSRALDAIKAGKPPLDAVYIAPDNGRYTPPYQLVWVKSPTPGYLLLYALPPRYADVPAKHTIMLMHPPGSAAYDNLLPLSLALPAVPSYPLPHPRLAIPRPPWYTAAAVCRCYIYDGALANSSLPAAYTAPQTPLSGNGAIQLAAWHFAAEICDTLGNYTPQQTLRQQLYGYMSQLAAPDAEPTNSQSIWAAATANMPQITTTVQILDSGQNAKVNITTAGLQAEEEFIFLVSATYQQVGTPYIQYSYHVLIDQRQAGTDTNWISIELEYGIPTGPTAIWLTLIGVNANNMPNWARHSATIKVL